MSNRILAVDVGGTFTDVIAIVDGDVLTAKVPTEPAKSYESVLAGAAEIGIQDASVFNVASTAGLNAVITRNLPKVGVLATEGHRDVLDGGHIGRPIEALADPGWRRGFGDSAAPLVDRYLRRGVTERLLANGEVLVPLDEDQAREQVRLLSRCHVAGVSICLINAYVNGAHERRLRELVREELGDIPCSISSEVSPLAKEYLRSTTTLIDVVMKIVYSDYTARLATGLADMGFEGQLNYSDCRAMLLSAEYAMESPHKLVAGGPAAGTLASAHFGGFIDDPQLICADVGGTSCDISLVVRGKPVTVPTFEIEYDLNVNAVSNEIITLGAGGGSIISVGAAGDIRTGPDSAGAEPGPACYGAGGMQPTLTDAALLMGILDEHAFLGGRKPLYSDLAAAAFSELDSSLPMAERIRFAWDMGLNNIAEGLLNLTIRHGIDIQEFTLMAFGAAGPMTLPGLLDLLPLRRVVVPPHPGLFSALGLVSSDRVFADQRCEYHNISAGGREVAERIDAIYQSMESRLLDRVTAEGHEARIYRTFDGRLVGQSWQTPFVDVPNGTITSEVLSQMADSFHDAYEERNANRFPAIGVEGVVYRVQAVVPSDKVDYPEVGRGHGTAGASQTTLKYLYDDDVPATLLSRSAMGFGDAVTGPAIVREDMATTFVPRGCSCQVGSHGELIIERIEGP